MGAENQVKGEQNNVEGEVNKIKGVSNNVSGDANLISGSGNRVGTRKRSSAEIYSRFPGFYSMMQGKEGIAPQVAPQAAVVPVQQPQPKQIIYIQP